VTAAEVERAKSRMIAEAVYARDSISGPANIFGAALATGRTIADVEAWPQRIAAVTVEQVDEAARFVIQESAAVTGVLLPDTTASATLPAAPTAPILPGASEPVHLIDDANPFIPHSGRID
jgi:zinc protease